MNIEISTDHLGRDISRFQDQLEALVRTKEEIYRCLAELDVMWEGTAKNVFVIQTQIDRAELQSFIEDMRMLIECLEHARSRYDQCSAEVDDRIAMVNVASGS